MQLEIEVNSLKFEVTRSEVKVKVRQSTHFRWRYIDWHFNAEDHLLSVIVSVYECSSARLMTVVNRNMIIYLMLLYIYLCITK